MKKWIAHSEGFAKGELHLNPQAVEIITGEQAASVLPVGVSRIEGEFEKDDIVKLIDEKGSAIGVGRVSIDSQEARKLLGKHGQRPLVHYDYLYLDETASRSGSAARVVALLEPWLIKKSMYYSPNLYPTDRVSV